MYFKSRGISEKEALTILSGAFLRSLTNKFSHPDVASYILGVLQDQGEQEE